MRATALRATICLAAAGLLLGALAGPVAAQGAPPPQSAPPPPPARSAPPGTLPANESRFQATEIVNAWIAETADPGLGFDTLTGIIPPRTTDAVPDAIKRVAEIHVVVSGVAP